MEVKPQNTVRQPCPSIASACSAPVSLQEARSSKSQSKAMRLEIAELSREYKQVGPYHALDSCSQGFLITTIIHRVSQH